MNGARLIAEERRRQVQREGWSPEHDAGHDRGEIAIVAAKLAVDGTDALVVDPHDCDWDCLDKHREDRIRQLTIAGALIAAEIDRLERAAGRRLVAPLLDRPWVLVSYIGTDDGRLSEITAAAEFDGIAVLARWHLSAEGAWACWVVDSESGSPLHEAVTDEEPVPATPPIVGGA